ncbi:MAG TPA: tetratricopeptide repeat protein [Candidatus Aquilonibacter sp.]|nr:tetratricopeptide repeat protein [Candidatus Aquilonibacter sp.]
MTFEQKIMAARELCDKSLWPDVLAFAQKWHAENPADAKALFFQGVALAAMGRFAEAETIYRRVLGLDASDFKAWNNLAGILFDSLNKPAEGLRCMEQALKLEPQNKLGWANLASIAGRLGRHEQALEFAGRALALDPQCVEAQLHKAAAAKALGRKELVKEACDMLATIEAEKFRRAR